MTTYARLVDGIVAEIIEPLEGFDISERFPPEFVAALVVYDPKDLPPVPVLPPPTTQQKAAAFTVQIQGILDARAQQDGFDGILAAVSYADEPAVPAFQTQGKAYRAWRSKVWDAAYKLLAAVEAGTKPEPTAETLPGLLPTYPG